MKLLPLIGVDELRFGYDLAKVIALKGSPPEQRTHSAPGRRTSFCYGPLTLGFDKNERLDFIAATYCDKRAELWGECPFDVAHRSAEPYENIRCWLGTLDLGVRADADSFGAYLSVPNQGVTFCFELPDCSNLQGIQLYPEG